MQLIRPIFFITLASITVEGFFFKFLFRPHEPKSDRDLFKAEGQYLELAQNLVKKWNGKSTAPYGKDIAKKSDMRIKYNKKKAYNGRDFTPIYIKKGKNFYAGLLAEANCDKEKIDGKVIKDAMLKSVEKKEMYTVKCDGSIKKRFN